MRATHSKHKAVCLIVLLLSRHSLAVRPGAASQARPAPGGVQSQGGGGRLEGCGVQSQGGGERLEGWLLPFANDASSLSPGMLVSSVEGDREFVLVSKQGGSCTVTDLCKSQSQLIKCDDLILTTPRSRILMHAIVQHKKVGLFQQWQTSLLRIVIQQAPNSERELATALLVQCQKPSEAIYIEADPVLGIEVKHASSQDEHVIFQLRRSSILHEMRAVRRSKMFGEISSDGSFAVRTSTVVPEDLWITEFDPNGACRHVQKSEEVSFSESLAEHMEVARQSIVQHPCMFSFRCLFSCPPPVKDGSALECPLKNFCRLETDGSCTPVEVAEVGALPQRGRGLMDRLLEGKTPEKAAYDDGALVRAWQTEISELDEKSKLLGVSKDHDTMLLEAVNSFSMMMALQNKSLALPSDHGYRKTMPNLMSLAGKTNLVEIRDNILGHLLRLDPLRCGISGQINVKRGEGMNVLKTYKEMCQSSPNSLLQLGGHEAAVAHILGFGILESAIIYGFLVGLGLLALGFLSQTFLGRNSSVTHVLYHSGATVLIVDLFVVCIYIATIGGQCQFPR